MRIMVISEVVDQEEDEAEEEKEPDPSDKALKEQSNVVICILEHCLLVFDVDHRVPILFHIFILRKIYLLKLKIFSFLH